MPRKNHFLDAVQVSSCILLAIFAVSYTNAFLGGRLNAFGIWPRTQWGLWGVLFSPLLHGSTAHLVANTASLFLLLVIFFYHREYRADKALIGIWLLSGFGTWLIGRPWGGGEPVVHIGASGLVYGLVAYIVATAWWRRSWPTILWAALILFLYGGAIYGLLPQDGPISWEGHLSGALAGWIVAYKQHG